MLTESQINAEVKRIFDEIQFTSEPARLYEPMKYMIEIGGKRIRPRLCLLCYSFYSDDLGPQICSPASAPEVFHSFTLMHDDIMDHSPLRRGMPTVWNKWGEDTAILSGDAMLIDSYKRVALAPSFAAAEIMNLFATTSAQVCDGQQYDMEFEKRREISMSEYENMIGLKTAVLIACSAKMGALIGNASEEQCEALYRYGYELGMAFQIADDYLDAFGDEKIFGKPIGGDIVNCKKSWLTVRAMEKCEDKDAFIRIFEQKPSSQEQKKAKIQSVKDIYVELGVDNDAKAEIQHFSEKAMLSVSKCGLSPLKIASLRRFADSLISRAK